MASGLASYGAQNWLAQLFSITAPLAGYYVALCTEEPGVDDDGDLLSDIEPDPAFGYARQLIPTGETDWALNGSFLTNLTGLDFGVPTGDWGTLSHYALLDGTGAANLYAFGAFLNPSPAGPGLRALLGPGAMVLSLNSLENSIAV